MDNATTRPIFVFGSNLAGRHGAGSAKEAMDVHGAAWGCGVGLRGFSYAIPTKDRDLKVLPLHRIKAFISDFLDYARRRPELEFQVVKVGCGLAGYKSEQIAPMFRGHPPNVKLAEDFNKVLRP